MKAAWPWRVLVLLYQSISYLLALAVFLYLIGFIANRYTFNSVDSGVQIPRVEAAVRNLFLVALVALQHSGMARLWWKRRIPWMIERPTYLLATSLAMAGFCFLWEPLPDLVWRVGNRAAVVAVEVAFALGWLLVLGAAAVMHHGHVFGWSQALAFWRGEPYRAPGFSAPGPYRYVRHPMMLGILTSLWAAPEMSEGRLFLAGILTVYILMALGWEERDLARTHGEAYRNYQRRVGRLLPRW